MRLVKVRLASISRILLRGGLNEDNISSTPAVNFEASNSTTIFENLTSTIGTLSNMVRCGSFPRYGAADATSGMEFQEDEPYTSVYSDSVADEDRSDMRFSMGVAAVGFAVVLILGFVSLGFYWLKIALRTIIFAIINS